MVETKIVFSSNRAGLIKPVHGVNSAPYDIGSGTEQAYIKKSFAYGGFPYSRLHDCLYPYGGKYFVDVTNIFPDFSANENEPESYDFYYTDELIGSIINAGAQIVYRLGVSIEHGTKKYTINPPADFGKWARICEHIVRHYNHGWKNGFTYGIKYWEIWNEPEHYAGSMWTGTREQFFDLYIKTSTHLKKTFPDIKVGGYGHCGFMAAYRKPFPDTAMYLEWYDDFLKAVKSSGCPLDFFSWHIYTDKPDEIEKAAAYARKTLNDYGFTNTESHLNEWNYHASVRSMEDKASLYGASFVAAALITIQNAPIDLAQYYTADLALNYNGLLDLRTHGFTPVICVFHVFNRLFKAKTRIEVVCDGGSPFVLAAKGEDDKAVALLSAYEKGVSVIKICNLKSVSVYKLVENDFVKVPVTVSCGETSFIQEPNGVYFIEEV